MIAPLASTSGIQPLAVSQINVSDRYYLYDDFTTARAAGAVNGTQAEPVGGVRTVVDTNSKISIAGGKITIATGTASGSDGVWWPIQTRRLGTGFLGSVTPTTGANGTYFGWDNAVNAGVYDAIGFRPSNALTIGSAGGSLLTVGAWTSTATYDAAIVMRAAGSFYFIKGNEYTNWTMLYSSNTGTMNLYPTLRPVSAAGAITLDNARASKQAYIPTPLQSDGMSATTTDGLGNPENNGPAGNSYSGVGTPQVSAGVRSFSALSGGGLGVSVLACTTPDVNIELNVIRTSGSAGIIARRVDANNYIQCLHNGTNVIVSQVVAGVSTTLSTTAVTYSAGATMKLNLKGIAYRAFYNNTAAGSGTVPASTNGNHGIITNNLSGSFDNLVIWASGAEGQYEDMNLL